MKDDGRSKTRVRQACSSWSDQLTEMLDGARPSLVVTCARSQLRADYDEHLIEPFVPEREIFATAASAGKTKVGFYQDPDDTAQARAAYDWTRPYEGHRSFSDFIAAAVMREVARLQAKHHDGQPWPAVEPGQLPTGKPLGS